MFLLMLVGWSVSLSVCEDGYTKTKVVCFMQKCSSNSLLPGETFAHSCKCTFVTVSFRGRNPVSVQYLQRDIRILHLHLKQQDPLCILQHHSFSHAT